MLHLSLAYGIPLKQLGEILSSRDIAEFIALNRVDPWGPVRADLQAATAAYGAASVWSDKIRISNFMLPYGQTEEDKEKEFRLRLQAHQIATSQFR